MIMLGEKPWVKYEEESPSYGKFIVEPLERGYGSTLGNGLRRILLAHLQGAAIVSIRIEDISHEFSTVPGVVEDVLEIILNLKEVVLKSFSDVPKVITLKAKGPGEVKAGDIEHDAEIEIANPDHKIATLESGGKLSIEMIVERGKGFSPAERNKKSTLPVGYIPIDSLFSPILKVNVVTEEMRVGQEINYDRLVLHVWTNGAIKPEEAIRESARILSRHIDLFLHVGEQIDVTPGEKERNIEIESGVLDMSLEDLELSARSLNCLKNANIKTVRELISFSQDELMKFKNFGTKSLNEVREKLSEYKLSLKGEEVSGSET
ncbi:MAG: DNA-directed RNA polymerase subunit alpha [Candidatus Margulisiibacteriota bacterium]